MANVIFLLVAFLVVVPAMAQPGPGGHGDSPPPPAPISGPNGLNINLFPVGGLMQVCHVLSLSSTTPPPPSTPTPSTTPIAPSTLPNTASTIVTTTTTTTTLPMLPTSPTPPPGPPTQSGTISLQLVSVTEKDNNSAVITQHQISPFVNIFSPLTKRNNVQLSSSVKAECNDALFPLPSLNASAALINVSICSILTNGSVQLNQESEDVFVGQVAVYFNVVNWPWCSGSDCDGQYGNCLELNISLQIQPDKSISADTKQNGKPQRYPMGFSDAYVDFSSQSNMDGTWKDLMDPLNLAVIKQNSNVTVPVRLQRASSAKISYFILVEPGYQKGMPPANYYNPITGSAQKTSSSFTFAVAVFLMTLIGYGKVHA